MWGSTGQTQHSLYTYHTLNTFTKYTHNMNCDHCKCCAREYPVCFKNGLKSPSPDCSCCSGCHYGPRLRNIWYVDYFGKVQHEAACVRCSYEWIWVKADPKIQYWRMKGRNIFHLEVWNTMVALKDRSLWK